MFYSQSKMKKTQNKEEPKQQIKEAFLFNQQNLWAQGQKRVRLPNLVRVKIRAS